VFEKEPHAKIGMRFFVKNYSPPLDNIAKLRYDADTPWKKEENSFWRWMYC
jgi:hypothetical protein